MELIANGKNQGKTAAMVKLILKHKDKKTLVLCATKESSEFIASRLGPDFEAFEETRSMMPMYDQEITSYYVRRIKED
jgi:hypothetical protein